MGGRGSSSGRSSKKVSLWADNGYGKKAEFINTFIEHGISISKPTGGTDNQNAYAQSIKEKVAKDLGKTMPYEGKYLEKYDPMKDEFIKLKNPGIAEGINNAKKAFQDLEKKVRNSDRYKALAQESGISMDETVNRLISSPRSPDSSAARYKILTSSKAEEIINIYNRSYNGRNWW